MVLLARLVLGLAGLSNAGSSFMSFIRVTAILRSCSEVSSRPGLCTTFGEIAKLCGAQPWVMEPKRPSRIP